MRDDQHARLEALKLAHRHDRNEQEVITRAEAYARFVLGYESKADKPAAEAGPARQRERLSPPKR